VVGLLARFFKGGLTIPDMMKMYYRNIGNPSTDILYWLAIYDLQTTEEEVVSELSYDSKGNKRDLPSGKKIREIVNNRRAERKKLNGSIK
jgi:hypothetical protein